MATLPVLNLYRTTKHYSDRREPLIKKFRSLYRFDPENVKWLADHLLGDGTETRRGALTTVQQMQTFLRYVADPGFQTGVGEDVGIDQSTACKTIHKVKGKIMEKAHLWIKIPMTCTEILKAKDTWNNKNKISSVIGVIDCSHVRISKPGQSGDEYINRKGWPSINVQATCNADEEFTSVNAEWPGSVHDSRIFKNSELYPFLNSIQDTVLLADSGYAISPSIITPYKRVDNEVQAYFNRVYAKERVIIERCFGQLKRRFPPLHYKVRVFMPSIPAFIICCFVLHNIAKYLKDADDFEELEENENPEIPYDGQDGNTTDAAVRARGEQQRNQIAEVLFATRTR